MYLTSALAPAHNIHGRALLFRHGSLTIAFPLISFAFDLNVDMSSSSIEHLPPFLPEVDGGGRGLCEAREVRGCRG